MRNSEPWFSKTTAIVLRGVEGDTDGGGSVSLLRGLSQCALPTYTYFAIDKDS